MQGVFSSPIKVLNIPWNNVVGRFGHDGGIQYFSCNYISHEVITVKKKKNSDPAGMRFKELTERQYMV